MLYLVLQQAFPLRPEAQYSLLAAELPLLSRLNERWHFKSVNWDGLQTSLNVAAPFLAEKKSTVQFSTQHFTSLRGRQLQIESCFGDYKAKKKKKKAAVADS